MSMLDGLDKEIYEAFKDDFRDGVLITTGELVPDGQGGFLEATNAPRYECKALVVNYNDYRRPAGIPATDRLVLVLGWSLPPGVIPSGGDQIIAPDPAKRGALTTFDVIAKAGDPASALFKLQGR